MSVSGANVGPTQSIPADGVIQLQFDRLLDVATVTRQSVLLVDADNRALNPSVTYDPVARVVTLGPQQGLPWLLPEQPYKIVLHPAASRGDTNGLRAIDGAPMSPRDPKLVIGFQTAARSGTPFAEPPVSFCFDVLPLFQRSCSASSCHGTPQPSLDTARFGVGGTSAPAAGLVLDSSNGVLATALNRAAHGANTGPLAGQGVSAGRVFGVDMPIVDPGNPGNSWLLYKLLLAPVPDPTKTTPAGFGRCGSAQDTAAGATCATGADCTTGRPHAGVRCDAATSTCVEGCETDADCALGETCDAAQTCSHAPPALGSACTSDAACGGPDWRRACDAGKCAVPYATPPLDPFHPARGFAPLAFATPMDDAERSALSDLVLGRGMPYPDMTQAGPIVTNRELTFDEMERVRLWIAQGAHVDPCGACDL